MRVFLLHNRYLTHKVSEYYQTCKTVPKSHRRHKKQYCLQVLTKRILSMPNRRFLVSNIAPLKGKSIYFRVSIRCGRVTTKTTSTQAGSPSLSERGRRVIFRADSIPLFRRYRSPVQSQVNLLLLKSNQIGFCLNT